MKADIHTIGAETAGSIELADHIFGLEPRADLIHRVIQWQLNKRQQGTHQAKSRGEITRTSLVWKAGLNGWVNAESQAELAGLFENVPPPLPR